MTQCPADPVKSADSGSSSGVESPPSEHRTSLPERGFWIKGDGALLDQQEMLGQQADSRIIRLLTPLVSAIQTQTEAINNLAASNMALVQAMAEDVGEDPDDPNAGSVYLDGSPRR